MSDQVLIHRLLDVVEADIAPMTRVGVEAGNKIFGAAVLRKDDLSLVLAATNKETENPLWHGEVQAIRQLHEMPRVARPAAPDCIFLATHEPCSLCLSAITWAGFDNFYYLFSHEDSRDAFAIPHDLRILKEVFGLDPGGYAKANRYWNSYGLMALIDACDIAARDGLLRRVEALKAVYDEMSALYQSHKAATDIPLK